MILVNRSIINSLLFFLLINCSLLLASSCSKESDLKNPDEEITQVARSLNLVSGNFQIGEAGNLLMRPIKFIVKDQNQSPIDGIEVYFEPSEGAVSADTVLTEGGGMASVEWTLGISSNKQILTIRAYKDDGHTPLEGSPFAVTAHMEEVLTEPLKVLFLGSSYFAYNHLPEIVNNLSQSLGKQLYIGYSIPLGLYLSDHLESFITEEKINSTNWDYVVLQGVGSKVYEEYEQNGSLYSTLQGLKKKILENHSSTKIIFCLPWAFEDGMTWVAGREDEDYELMQAGIISNTLLLANDLNLIISPVGSAWNNVLSEKNYPLHYLHLSDWNHPNIKGSYLTACTIFSTIFQESTLGSSFYGDISEEEARYFQKIASKTVLNNLNLWNIIAK